MNRYYYLKGSQVEIITRWKGKGPRNVLIRKSDGELVVRPFRGLRKEVKA